MWNSGRLLICCRLAEKHAPLLPADADTTEGLPTAVLKSSHSAPGGSP